MSKERTSPFATVSRLLVGGAVFFTVLLVGAAILTSHLGDTARSALTREEGAITARLAAAEEINALLGRGGLTGRLMIYATEPSPDTLALMSDLTSDARGQLNALTINGTEQATIFAGAARARIAESELAIAAIEAGTRDAATVAMEFADGVAPFEIALNRLRLAEQDLQTSQALSIFELQRWIVGITLALGIIVMAGAAILFWLGIRRPLRQLADHLEDLMVDEEERELPEADRSDEVGEVARIAAQIRRSQLQAGRLLTFGPDGALRFRLEGASATAVDDALGELKVATETARVSAETLTSAEGRITSNSDAVMARLEAALSETIAETSGQLQNLSDAGESVIRLAGDLEGARRSFAGTEEEWREEMIGLGETMRGEFERLRGTADRLAQITEAAAGRTEVAGTRIDALTSQLSEDQAKAIAASEDTRASLAIRLESLDAQIAALGTTLKGFETLSAETITPIQAAKESLMRSVMGLNESTREAATATGFWSREVDAAHKARAHATSEAEADRAYWKKEREALRMQIDTTMNELVETAARVGRFAEDLHTGADGLPARFDALQAEIAGLGTKIGAFENVGTGIIGKLGGQLASVHEALQDARDAFYRESITIGEVTGDLKSLHLRFDSESRVIGEQVVAISDSLETLDENLLRLTDRLSSPVDLTPVLAALRNEMGRAVTHLTRVVEGESQTTRAAFSQESSTVIARELAEFSEALKARIALEGEQTTQLIEAMDDMRERMSINDGAPSTAAILEPRLVSLSETTRAIAHEVRAISDKIASGGSEDGEIITHISRVERLQSGLSQAQAAIATSMQEGMAGIARRLRSSDSDAATRQIERAFSSLMQQQLQLENTIRDTVSDLGARIDDLAEGIARSSTPIARRDTADTAGQFATSVRPGATPRPSEAPAADEADLSAIYDALRGLTEELKDLSVDTSDEPAARSGNTRQAS